MGIMSCGGICLPVTPGMPPLDPPMISVVNLLINNFAGLNSVMLIQYKYYKRDNQFLNFDLQNL